MSDRTVRRVLREMPDEFLECRYTRLHAVRRIGIYRWSGRLGGKWKAIVFECQTCGTIREDFVSPSGVLEMRRYERPEGYLLSGRRNGKGRFTLPSEEVRRELLNRVPEIEIFDTREQVLG